jgi:hypothetical protein
VGLGITASGGAQRQRASRIELQIAVSFCNHYETMSLIVAFTLIAGSMGFGAPSSPSYTPQFGACMDCDGRHLVGLTESKRLAVWDATTGRMIRILEGYQDPVYLARLLPDGKSVLAQSFRPGTDWATWGITDKGPRDNSMRLWDIDSGKVLWRIPDSFFDAISRDGKRVYGVQSKVSPNLEQPKMVCWDIRTGSPLFTMPGFAPLGFLSNIVEESADGRRLLYSDSYKVTIFDLLSRKKLVDIENGRGVGVLPASFVGDGDKFFYDSPSSRGTTVALYSVSKDKVVVTAEFPSERTPFVIGWLPRSAGFVAFCNWGRWMSFSEGAGLVDRGEAAVPPFDIFVSPDGLSFAASYREYGDQNKTTLKVEGYNARTFKKTWERPGVSIKCLSNGQLVIQDGDSVSFVDIYSGLEKRTIHLEGFLAKRDLDLARMSN